MATGTYETRVGTVTAYKPYAVSGGRYSIENGYAGTVRTAAGLVSYETFEGGTFWDAQTHMQAFYGGRVWQASLDEYLSELAAVRRAKAFAAEVVRLAAKAKRGA